MCAMIHEDFKIPDIDVNIGDPVLSGNSDDSRIGHVIRITTAFYHIYFGETETVLHYDVISAKRGRKYYRDRYGI